MTAPHDIALFGHLACLWEATARKPGNVHRFRDFSDISYLDFLASAAALAPVLADAPNHSVGTSVLEAVRRTRLVAPGNTNLGIILLLVPLAKAAGGDLASDLPGVLKRLTVKDSADVYTAIRLAQPGGLGRVKDQDVSLEPTLPLREVMALAADRDLIARQIAHGFREVLEVGVPILRAALDTTGSLEGAIVYTQLRLMSRFPDTLIARKLGRVVAEGAARRAQAILQAGWPQEEKARRLLTAFDNWLRERGNRRNPGTTADMIAACLFVLLCEGEIRLPLSWPWECAALD